MKKPKFLVLLGMLLTVMLLAAPASAFVAWEWNTTPNQSSIGSHSLGAEFRVNYDITVTELGFFDEFGDGLAENHAVGIYDLNQNLLTSTTVTNGDGLVGHFRYHPTTAVTLLAGQTYRIAAVTGSENYAWAYEQFLITDPGVTYLYNVYTASNVLVYPNNSNQYFGYFGPNFRDNPVPVPPTLLLFGSGLLGLAAWRRYRKG